MPYGAGMAGLPGAMPGYPGMYNQAQYPAYMAAPYGLHSPYALHPGFAGYPQAPPAPLARPARSILAAGEGASACRAWGVHQPIPCAPCSEGAC
jgi:hypothetical protein